MGGRFRGVNAEEAKSRWMCDKGPAFLVLQYCMYRVVSPVTLVFELILGTKRLEKF